MAKNMENNYLDLPKDRFGCIHISSSVHLSLLTPDELQTTLSVSLPRWQILAVRGVWAKINIKSSQLIPSFVNNGFEFHHAQPKYVMMKKWLNPSEVDTLPPYANQYLGSSGFVVNDKNQLLVVQELYSDVPHWKLPGGHANPGEEIGEAAEREVFEETGVRAEFQCIICFRHMHHYRFGCSDFYFISLLKPLTHDIKKCDREIAAATWIDLDEYMNHPSVTENNRYFAECYKSMVTQGSFTLKPTEIVNYSQTGYHKVYSLISTDKDKVHSLEPGEKKNPPTSVNAPDAAT